MAEYSPISAIPYQIINPDTGAPASGFTLEAYQAEGNTPAMMYQDSEGTPLGTSVQINSAGYPSNGSAAVMIWLSTSISYKFILKNSSGVQQWSFDNISFATGGSGSSGSVSFDTIADFQAGQTSSGIVYVKGFDSPADGGQGYFWLDTSDTTSDDNGGTFIVDSTTPRIGTWKRIQEEAGITRAAWFGLKPGTWNESAALFMLTWACRSGNGRMQLESGRYSDYLIEGFNLPLITDEAGNPKFTNLTLEGNNTEFYKSVPFTTRSTPWLNILHAENSTATANWEFKCKDIKFTFLTGSTSYPRIWDITRGKSIIFENCSYDGSTMFLSVGGNQYSVVNGLVEFKEFTHGFGVTVGRKGQQSLLSTADRQFTFKFTGNTRLGNSSLVNYTAASDVGNNLGSAPLRPFIHVDGFYNRFSTTTALCVQNAQARNSSLFENLFNYAGVCRIQIDDATGITGTPDQNNVLTVRNAFSLEASAGFRCEPIKIGHVIYENVQGFVVPLQNHLTADNYLTLSYINTTTSILAAFNSTGTVTSYNSRFYSGILTTAGAGSVQLISSSFATSWNTWTGYASPVGLVQYWGSRTATNGNTTLNFQGNVNNGAATAYNVSAGVVPSRSATGTYNLRITPQAPAITAVKVNCTAFNDNTVAYCRGVTNGAGYTDVAIVTRTHNSDSYADQAFSFDISYLAGEVVV